MDGHAAGGSALPARLRMPARLLRIATDERLVELVRGGSEPAFEVLYDRHHRGVLSFCRHMLADAGEAEDALQHTFLAAYRDLQRSAKDIRLRPWLYAIARNRCLSVLRARRERPVDELGELATEHLSAEVQRRDDLRELLRDLSALPDDQRAALVLSELRAVAHEDIAQVLDCPREKVKALVFQARSSLAASRAGREASCEEIREQLATLRGGALRRTTLRRHLDVCPGCRAFRDEMRVQRRALAIVLPVVPSAGLKEAVLGSVLGGGGAAGGAAAGAGGAAAAAGVGGGAAGGGALAAKALVVVALAGGGTAATVEVARHDDRPAPAAERVAAANPGAGPADRALAVRSDVAGQAGVPGHREARERGAAAGEDASGASRGDDAARKDDGGERGERGRRRHGAGHRKGHARGGHGRGARGGGHGRNGAPGQAKRKPHGPGGAKPAHTPQRPATTPAPTRTRPAAPKAQPAPPVRSAPEPQPAPVQKTKPAPPAAAAPPAPEVAPVVPVPPGGAADKKG